MSNISSVIVMIVTVFRLEDILSPHLCFLTWTRYRSWWISYPDLDHLAVRAFLYRLRVSILLSSLFLGCRISRFPIVQHHNIEQAGRTVGEVFRCGNSNESDIEKGVLGRLGAKLTHLRVESKTWKLRKRCIQLNNLCPSIRIIFWSSLAVVKSLENL